MDPWLHKVKRACRQIYYQRRHGAEPEPTDPLTQAAAELLVRYRDGWKGVHAPAGQVNIL